MLCSNEVGFTSVGRMEDIVGSAVEILCATAVGVDSVGSAITVVAFTDGGAICVLVSGRGSTVGCAELYEVWTKTDVS